MHTIVVVGGYWSTNIGNSFFQLGAYYILKKTFPRDRVIMLSDQPGYWNTKVGNPKNAFILLEHIQLDFLVILGPFLRHEYECIWYKTLKILYQKGVKIIILGAGMMKYDENEIRRCRTLLAETPPYIFISRDRETYNFFGDLADHSYDGIDLAFFVSDFFSPIPISVNKYVIFNFDQIPEPYVEVYDSKPCNKKSAWFEGKWLVFKFPFLRYALAKKFKIFPFIDAFILWKFSKKILDFDIIRTDHRFNPMLLRKAYRGPNSFVSDIPFTYLNLYANTTATFTNRVHACVATLAYGRPAMLFSHTLRVRLLERLGLYNITEELQSLDIEKLNLEKKNLINFLKSVSVIDK